ncbi:MAG: hypothetical protein NC201_04170 [Prevotella sp.]|nr:hypothetical protein [Bacteroides sp.]MCM1366425.1 hypothetical protein [Prevotella sp.]
MNENTIYDRPDFNQKNEETQYDNLQSQNRDNEQLIEDTNTPNEEQAERHAKGMSKGAKAAAGIGGGILLGGLAVGLTSMAKNDGDEAAQKSDTEDRPDWLVNDNVKVAHNVTDDMSFDEAFAAAREEVGPGGAFEWHGKVYGTYTSSEWNSMSAAERNEWSANFEWDNITPEHGSVASSHTAHHTTTVHEEHIYVKHDDTTSNTNNNNDEANRVRETTDTPTRTGNQTTHTPGHTGGEGESEFEVLAVVHDDENNTNLGLLKINGQDVYVIDLDNDQTFDVMAYDQNHDGKIDQSEYIDIRDGGVTVESLGGYRVNEELMAQRSMSEEQSGHEGDNLDYSQDTGNEQNGEEILTGNHADENSEIIESSDDNLADTGVEVVGINDDTTISKADIADVQVDVEENPTAEVTGAEAEVTVAQNADVTGVEADVIGTQADMAHVEYNEVNPNDNYIANDSYDVTSNYTAESGVQDIEMGTSEDLYTDNSLDGNDYIDPTIDGMA